MEFLSSVLPFILEGGIVAVLTFFITARQIKRKASLNNDSTQISNLEAVIKDLRQEADDRRTEREQYRSDLSQEREKNEALREENTAIKMLMCTHMGCAVRHPLMGQGDSWYQAHKGEASLGADYLPINQLIQQYGLNKKKDKDDGDNQ